MLFCDNSQTLNWVVTHSSFALFHLAGQLYNFNFTCFCFSLRFFEGVSWGSVGGQRFVETRMCLRLNSLIQSTLNEKRPMSTGVRFSLDNLEWLSRPTGSAAGRGPVSLFLCVDFPQLAKQAVCCNYIAVTVVAPLLILCWHFWLYFITIENALLCSVAVYFYELCCIWTSPQDELQY